MARAATPPRVEGTALFWSRVSSHRDDEPDEVLFFSIQAPKYDSSATKSYTCGETLLKAASLSTRCLRQRASLCVHSRSAAGVPERKAWRPSHCETRDARSRQQFSPWSRITIAGRRTHAMAASQGACANPPWPQGAVTPLQRTLRLPVTARVLMCIYSQCAARASTHTFAQRG